MPDERTLLAVYPYTKLREIQTPADARDALLDQTQALEEEFGPDAMTPLYQLVWTLNSCSGVFTSHTAIAPNQSYDPPLKKAYVAVQFTLLSRNREDHHDDAACLSMVQGLKKLLSCRTPESDYTDWQIDVGPCDVIFTKEMASTTFRSVLPDDRRGCGCELTIGGMGDTRNMAAQRFTQALIFVDDTLQQFRGNLAPAPPHRHLIPGMLPKT